MKRLFPALLLGWAATAAAQAPPEIHFVPLSPSVSDRITILIEGTGCPLLIGPIQVDEGRITLNAVRSQPPTPCGAPPWALELPFGRLKAGRYAVELKVQGEPAIERELAVDPPDETRLFFSFFDEGPLPPDFTATLDWSFPGQTATHPAYAIDVSPQAGYFWFFSPDNPEVAVKIVNGMAFNGHAWLFVSSLTTLPFTLTLTSCPPFDPPPPCKVRTYRYPGGRGRLIIDVTLE
ncbi:MAG: hypothetical protein ACRDHY_16660 [Anaerolineales bacterium]